MMSRLRVRLPLLALTVSAMVSGYGTVELYALSGSCTGTSWREDPGLPTQWTLVCSGECPTTPPPCMNEEDPVGNGMDQWCACGTEVSQPSGPYLCHISKVRIRWVPTGFGDGYWDFDADCEKAACQLPLCEPSEGSSAGHGTTIICNCQ